MRLDADTKEIVKFLTTKGIKVSSPIDIRFTEETAIIAIKSSGFWGQREVVVISNNNYFDYLERAKTL